MLITGAAVVGIVIGMVFLGFGLYWEHLLSQASSAGAPYLGSMPRLARSRRQGRPGSSPQIRHMTG